MDVCGCLCAMGVVSRVRTRAVGCMCDAHQGLPGRVLMASNACSGI